MEKKFLKNKKGTASDIIFIAVILFMFALAFIIGHYIVGTMVDKMVLNTEINSSNAAVTALQATKSLTNRFDYIMFGVFIAVSLGLIISSWFIAEYPIFVIFYFIFIVLAVILSKVMSEVWNFVIAESLVGASVTAFPITAQIMQYLPIYITVIGFIGLVVMFAKPYFQGGRSG